MKNIHESVFMSSLRALFVSFFAVIGLAVAVTLVCLTYYGLSSAIEEESFSSKIKILPNAEGDRTKLSSNTPILLQISIDGEIGKDRLTGKHFEEILLETHEDALKGRIKGILLFINSPGGGVNDSDIIYRLLKEYKESYNIPIYAYIDGLCASGGYYAACAANKIYATHSSLVGSIGVLSWPPFVNLSEAMKKIGVDSLTLSAGRGKDELNPFRAWETDEHHHYQTIINFYYNRFVDIVCSNRKLDKEILIQDHGAKVYPAPEAQTIGLIDGEGYTRAQVLAELAQAAGIEKKYQVIGFETKSWWTKLMKEESNSPLITGKIKHEFPLPSYHGNPFSYLFIP
jgi:protease-4